MQERIRNLEDFAQLSAKMTELIDSAQRRMEERQQRMEVDNRRMEEDQRRRDELLQQILRSVAVMQAEIVRIDETHS